MWSYNFIPSRLTEKPNDLIYVCYSTGVSALIALLVHYYKVTTYQILIKLVAKLQFITKLTCHRYTEATGQISLILTYHINR